MIDGWTDWPVRSVSPVVGMCLLGSDAHTHQPTNQPTSLNHRHHQPFPPTQQVKHAFITKFNEIDAACYDRAREELGREVLTAQRAGMVAAAAGGGGGGGAGKGKQAGARAARREHAHVVCKKVGGEGEGRGEAGKGSSLLDYTALTLSNNNTTTTKPRQIGLAQLPLAAVALRFSAIAWAASCDDGSALASAPAVLAFAGLLFLVLLLSKLASGILLTQWAARVERGERERRARRLTLPLPQKQEKGPAPVPPAAVTSS